MKKKNSRDKFQRTKHTDKVSEYISLMQSINSIAGYSRKIEWETVFNGLKRDLKKMWAIYPNPPKDLEARYAKLSEFGMIVDDIEDESKKSSGGKGGDENESEKSKSRRRRRGKGKKSTAE